MKTLLLLPLLAFPSSAPSQDSLTIELLQRAELPRLAMPLEDFDLTPVDQGWGRPQRALSVDGNPLTIGGHVFAHGIGTHAAGEMAIKLGAAAKSFHAAVGVDSETGELGSVQFLVIGDGKELGRSPVLHGGDAPHVFDLDLTGVREVLLVVEDGGDDINYDHADWGGAHFVLDPLASTLPYTMKFAEDPVPDIVRAPRDAPEIHAPLVVGATPGRPFLFRIPTSGKRPLVFTAEGLPPGLELAPGTGIITGHLESVGHTPVKLHVDGPAGSDDSTLTIIGGEHQLARTPPMGWNSWNVWGLAVDDAKVRAAADWLVRSGLADAGYSYINIDDAWEGERNAEGVLEPNDKFPDMRALANYVHAKGLKLGIYSSPGEWTCGGYAASLGHEVIDAKTWADWGIDYLKYDWCSYESAAKDHSQPELEKPYRVMRAALDATDRDIVFSLCQYGMGDVSTWGAEVGGNLWRTTYDITDSWSSMTGLGFAQAGLATFAGPGHWNDPDMLVVGRLGWGPSLHDTRLTKNEQLTHITLWSMLAAPLLIGCDLTAIDDFTLALLTHPEMIAIDQDPLGVQAERIKKDGNVEIWQRDLADGSAAVALFNRGRRATEVTLRADDFFWSGPMNLFDIWQQKDLGKHKDSYTTEVPRHGVVFLRVH
jgi:alpha-galactosidase